MHDGLVAWLRAVAARVHEEAPALTALDQAIGDGDHGINMDRGFAAIVAMLDAREAPAADGSRRRGDGGSPPAGGQDADQHGRRGCRPALRDGVPARSGGPRRASIPRPRRPSSRRSRQPPAGSPASARPPRARRRCSTRCSRPPGPLARRSTAAAISRRWSQRPTTRRMPASPRRSRCSRRRAAPRTSGSAASATRTPARRRRRSCSACLPRSRTTD